jgi:hypothetical protein
METDLIVATPAFVCGAATNTNDQQNAGRRRTFGLTRKHCAMASSLPSAGNSVSRTVLRGNSG